MASSFPPHELVRLSDLNFAECAREHARWCERGVIDERDGTLRTVSATRFPAGMFNAVMCTGETPADPEQWLQAQLEFYTQEQRGFSIYTRGDRDQALVEACLDAGLAGASAAPGMVCDGPLVEPPRDPRVSFEFVNTPALLSRWVEVQVSAYATLGMPEHAVLEAMQSPERMLDPHSLFLLGRYDGAPVAAAMALLSHGIAGLYWIGVRPEQRNRGLGEATTRAITNAAFARGAQAVVLQASSMGLPIYLQLGFREITSYPWFVAGRSVSGRPVPLRQSVPP
jgi:ribosomal protein S18 acetylase RimI-like enzyme